MTGPWGRPDVAARPGAIATRFEAVVQASTAVRITPELLRTPGMRVVIVCIVFHGSRVYKGIEVPGCRLAWHFPRQGDALRRAEVGDAPFSAIVEVGLNVWASHRRSSESCH
jgi:hypothetical protein